MVTNKLVQRGLDMLFGDLTMGGENGTSSPGYGASALDTKNAVGETIIRGIVDLAKSYFLGGGKAAAASIANSASSYDYTGAYGDALYKPNDYGSGYQGNAFLPSQSTINSQPSIGNLQNSVFATAERAPTINVTNNSSTPIESSNVMYDERTKTVSVILEDLNNNGMISQTLAARRT